MDIEVKLFHKDIDKSSFERIKKIVDDSGIDEPVYWEQVEFYILGECEKGVISIILYAKQSMDNGTFIPRFMHIITTPDFKRSKASYIVLKQSQVLLKNDGYNQIFLSIRHDLPRREMKRNMAVNFGYVKYFEDTERELFYKNI